MKAIVVSLSILLCVAPASKSLRAANLDDLGDVIISTPTPGQTIRNQSGMWVNQNDWINVLDFGADPTGTLDATLAVRAALDAAAAKAEVLGAPTPQTANDVIVGVDGGPGSVYTPVQHGAVVYFPAGQYSLSGTIEVRNATIKGSQGTEIQFAQNGTYDQGAAVHLYGHCQVDGMFFDLFQYDNGIPRDNVSGAPSTPDITLFLAPSMPPHPTYPNSSNEARFGHIVLSNIVTLRYTPSFREFYRNEHNGTTVHAYNCRFRAWHTGFNLRGTADENHIVNCGAWGAASLTEAQPSSAFINSNGGIQLGVVNSGAVQFASLLRITGDYPEWHSITMTNCTSEHVRTGILVEGSAAPSLGVSNSHFIVEESHVMANGQAVTVDGPAQRFMSFDNCRFTFRNERTEIMNLGSIVISGRKVPISITDCTFEGYVDTQWPAGYPLSYVRISDNGTQPMTFNSNTMRASASAYPASYGIVHFLNPGGSVVVSGNNVRGKSVDGRTILMSGTGSYFTATGNHTQGSIYTTLQAGKFAIYGNTNGN